MCKKIKIFIIIVISIIGFVILFIVLNNVLFRSSGLNDGKVTYALPLEMNLIDWKEFNSVEDAGIKFDFSFQHLEEWSLDEVNKNISGGSSSYIPFYIEDKEGDKKLVASILVNSNGGAILENKQYDNLSESDIEVDGYKAIERSGNVPGGADLDLYLGDHGEKERGVVIPDVNGTRFEFTVLDSSLYSFQVVNKLISSLNFNF